MYFICTCFILYPDLYDQLRKIYNHVMELKSMSGIHYDDVNGVVVTDETQQAWDVLVQVIGQMSSLLMVFNVQSLLETSYVQQIQGKGLATLCGHGSFFTIEGQRYIHPSWLSAMGTSFHQVSIIFNPIHATTTSSTCAIIVFHSIHTTIATASSIRAIIIFNPIHATVATTSSIRAIIIFTSSPVFVSQ